MMNGGLRYIDIIEVLTDRTDPRQYTKRMRKRDAELNSYWGTICTPLPLMASMVRFGK